MKMRWQVANVQECRRFVPFESYKSFSSFARATALMRLFTFNLLLMFLVWVFTVFKDLGAHAATELPAANRQSILRCAFRAKVRPLIDIFCINTLPLHLL